MAATIDIRDEVTPIMQALSPALRRDAREAIGAAVVLLFQTHIGALPSNKNNWPTTSFWKSASKACNHSILADQVNINVNWQGFRQRLEGGKIEAQNSNWLTIPARAEAYGKRAREFSNLEPVFFKSPHGFFGALVEAGRQNVSFGRKRKDGSHRVIQGEEHGGGVFYWLKKSVIQQPNPNAIPSEQQITDTITRTVEGVAERAMKRGGQSA